MCHADTAPNTFVYPPGPAFLSVKFFILLKVTTIDFFLRGSGTFLGMVSHLTAPKFWSVMAPTHLLLRQRSKVLMPIAKNYRLIPGIGMRLTMCLPTFPDSNHTIP